MEGDRPFPVVVGFPIEMDPEAPGVSAVIIPGSGLIVDPLTGKAWGSDEVFMLHIVSLWNGWLLEHKHVSAPPQRTEYFVTH
jgi:hypothetical protein